MQGFYDAKHVAQRLGVKPGDVTKWADRPTPNFPLPTAVLCSDSGRDRPLWAKSQIPDLRSWLAARLRLSDPEAHWALVDSGQKQPGGHQDQMMMFHVEREKADTGPDGLFPVPVLDGAGKE